MYLSEIEVEGFRCLKNKTKIKFNKGINLLVGDNRSGKSTIIDSIRLLLQENEYYREGIKTNDFYHSIDGTEKSEKIKIKGKFSELSNDKKIEYITWLDENFDAILNLEIYDKLDGRSNYKKKIWGGISSNSIFEWDVFNDIQCVYLPALRDAERQLKNIKGSRLGRLILNLSKEEREKCKKNNELTDLEKKVDNFNKELIGISDIEDAKKLINKSLKESLGSKFLEKINIQFGEQSYIKIVENLKLMFSNDIDTKEEKIIFNDLVENSLGYNNLIYIATILAEFEGLKEKFSTPRILLIEEIEAHLNPQIQVKLIQFLSEQAEKNDIQIIITTHSSIIASSISINNIINFSYINNKVKITSLKDCELEENERKFIDRWMDATKSTLLFSRGVLLVEGLAENLLISKLAKIYLLQKKYSVKSIEEAGISVINMNGILFQYFLKLYDGYAPISIEKKEDESKTSFKERKKNFLQNEKFKEGEFKKTDKIPIRCVALTDFDPDKAGNSRNPQFFRIKQVENMSDNCRIFVNKRTFEYDLAIESKQNAKIMLEILEDYIDTEGENKNKINDYLTSINKDIETKEDIKPRAEFILNLIGENWMGKGLFAQLLLEKIENNEFDIPKYITDAIDFLLGEKINDK